MRKEFNKLNSSFAKVTKKLENAQYNYQNDEEESTVFSASESSQDVADITQQKSSDNKETEKHEDPVVKNSDNTTIEDEQATEKKDNDETTTENEGDTTQQKETGMEKVITEEKEDATHVEGQGRAAADTEGAPTLEDRDHKEVEGTGDQKQTVVE